MGRGLGSRCALSWESRHSSNVHSVMHFLPQADEFASGTLQLQLNLCQLVFR